MVFQLGCDFIRPEGGKIVVSLWVLGMHNFFFCIRELSELCKWIIYWFSPPIGEQREDSCDFVLDEMLSYKLEMQIYYH